MMFEVASLLRSDLQNDTCFQEPQAVQPAGLADDEIKADANENPYGCIPEAQAALSGVLPSLYPDPSYRQLRREIASYCGVDPVQVVPGNGADELIDLVLRACLEPGEEVVNLTPTFGMYEFFIRLNRGQVVEVPRDEEFNVPVDRVLQRLTSQTKAIVACSPNNPTGNLLPQRDLLALLDTGRLVILDETYYEFCGQTALPLLRDYPNLAVIRSLSKWAGMAGLRLGYAILPLEMATFLNRIRPPYNVNAAAQAAAMACLRHRDAALASAGRIARERDRLFAQLRAEDFLRPLPSQTNFILCFVRDGEMSSLREFLEGQGIWLRWFRDPRLERAVRITVGRPAHTDRLVTALREWRESL